MSIIFYLKTQWPYGQNSDLICKKRCSKFHVIKSTSVSTTVVVCLFFFFSKLDRDAIINGLRVYLLDIRSYFDVSCQESSKLLHFDLGATLGRGYEMQTSGKAPIHFLQNSRHALKSCVLTTPSLLLHFIWGFKYPFHPAQPLAPLFQAAPIQRRVLAPWPSQWPPQKQLCVLLRCKSSQTSRTCSFWHPALSDEYSAEIYYERGMKGHYCTTFIPCIRLSSISYDFWRLLNKQIFLTAQTLLAPH